MPVGPAIFDLGTLAINESESLKPTEKSRQMWLRFLRRSADMNDKTEGFEQSDEAILPLEVSDAALEAAASSTPSAAAMSFPKAPTVSILVMCCSNG